MDEVAAQDRYAGMLVSKHAAGIYTGRYGTQTGHDRHARAGSSRPPSTRSWPARRRGTAACSEELGVDEEELWRNYVLLQVFDRLSLWLCRGRRRGAGPHGDHAAGPRRAAGGRADRGRRTLAPWPFGGDERCFEVPVRTVPLEGYADDADFQARVAATPVERRRERLAPL